MKVGRRGVKGKEGEKRQGVVKGEGGKKRMQK